MDRKLTGNLNTTGIGSLPFTDPEAAVTFVLENGPDIPFWPQLPAKTPAEDMIAQFVPGMPCVRWDGAEKQIILDTSDKYGELEKFYTSYLSGDHAHFALHSEHASGFFAFREALQTAGKKPAALKGQITGPLTFTMGISDQDGRTLYSDPELRDAAVKLLTYSACWQAQQLKDLGAKEVVIFADEPVLAAYGSSAYVGISEEAVTGMLSEIFNAISDAGAIPGMHVCGNSDWAMAMRCGPVILNFDAYQYGATLGLYAGDLKQFLDGGGVVAWGIVPTTTDIENENLESLMSRFNSVLDGLEAKGISRSEILKQSLLTPSCGAGSLDDRRAEKVFSLLKALKFALRACTL